MSTQQGKDTASSNWTDNIKDGVAIFASLSAFIVAFLWFIGLNLLSSSFGELGIPVGMMGLSIWNYGASGMLVVIFLFGKLLPPILILIFIHSLLLKIYPKRNVYYTEMIISTLLSIFAMIVGYLGLIEKLNLYTLLMLVVSLMFVTSFNFFSIASFGNIERYTCYSLILLISFMMLSSVASELGLRGFGQINTYHMVKITLSAPILNGVTFRRINTNSTDIYTSENLYLLSDSNGRYIFFQRYSRL